MNWTNGTVYHTVLVSCSIIQFMMNDQLMMVDKTDNWKLMIKWQTLSVIKYRYASNDWVILVASQWVWKTIFRHQKAIFILQMRIHSTYHANYIKLTPALHRYNCLNNCLNFFKWTRSHFLNIQKVLLNNKANFAQLCVNTSNVSVMNVRLRRPLGI